MELIEDESLYNDVKEMLTKIGLGTNVSFVIAGVESKSKPPVTVKLIKQPTNLFTDKDFILLLNNTFFDRLSIESQKDFLDKAINSIVIDMNTGNVVLEKPNLIDNFKRVEKVGLNTVETAFIELEQIKEQIKEEELEKKSKSKKRS